MSTGDPLSIHLVIEEAFKCSQLVLLLTERVYLTVLGNSGEVRFIVEIESVESSVFTGLKSRVNEYRSGRRDARLNVNRYLLGHALYGRRQPKCGCALGRMEGWKRIVRHKGCLRNFQLDVRMREYVVRHLTTCVKCSDFA